MTTLATDDPAHVRVGARLLGHSSLRTGERHYNQATMVSAVTQYHETLAQLRGNTPPPEEPTP
jgi:integrase/recombinase XerD